jgi:hypothetical protein
MQLRGIDTLQADCDAALLDSGRSSPALPLGALKYLGNPGFFVVGDPA